MDDETRVMLVLANGKASRVITTGIDRETQIWNGAPRSVIDVRDQTRQLPAPAAPQASSQAAAPARAGYEDSPFFMILVGIVAILAIVGCVYLARWIAGALPDSFPAIVRWLIAIGVDVALFAGLEAWGKSP